jgi:cytochrome c-type biogenesis protein CcmH
MRARLLLLLLLTPIAHAGIDVWQFPNAQDEALYNRLTHELRCTVCQNQDIADSNADLAGDLRRKTYQMVTEGKSEKEVLDYMVARYGDFVLYRPPFDLETSVLWLGPFALLVIGVVVLFRIVRRQARGAGPDLSADEIKRASHLLEVADEEPKS